MTDPVKDPKKDDGTPKDTEPTVEELKKQLAEKDTLIEGVKKAQSGSDATVTTLKLEMEDLRKSLKEKMTDTEKAELATKEDKNRLSALETELEEIRSTSAKDKLENYKLKKMGEAKLDAEFADFITGDSEENMDSAIEKFKKNLDEKFKAIKEDNMDTGNPPKGTPGGGKKTMKRSDFENLPQSEKGEAAANHTITD